MTTCHDIYSLDDAPATRRIVVGVDASEASLAALRWAVREARISGARVEAVHVYRSAPDTAFTGAYPAVGAAPPDRARLEALTRLRAAVARVTDGRDPVELVALPGATPATVLARYAAGAAMLVVGGAGPTVRLGRTLATCIRTAQCPVVVVAGGVAGVPHPTRQTPRRATAATMSPAVTRPSR